MMHNNKYERMCSVHNINDKSTEWVRGDVVYDQSGNMKIYKDPGYYEIKPMRQLKDLDMYVPRDFPPRYWVDAIQDDLIPCSLRPYKDSMQNIDVMPSDEDYEPSVAGGTFTCHDRTYLLVYTTYDFNDSTVLTMELEKRMSSPKGKYEFHCIQEIEKLPDIVKDFICEMCEEYNISINDVILTYDGKLFTSN